MRDTPFDDYATAKLKNARIKRYDNQPRAYFELCTNRIDFLFADSLVLEQDFLKRPKRRHSEMCLDPVTDPKYFGDGIVIGVRLDDKKLADEFNAAIKAIRDSGEYQRISKKYFDRDIHEDSSPAAARN